MPFRFPLQAVLHFRLNVERQEELRLSVLNQRIASVTQRMGQIANRIRELCASSSDDLVAGTTSAELRFTLTTEGVLQHQHQELERDLTRLQGLQSQQQRVFHHARRQRETIESLRDQQLDEYRRNAARREQLRLDESFLLRLGHIRRG